MRQSISLTLPNNEWLNEQVESQEYASKSEVINDLIRRAREKQDELDWIRGKLIEGEQRGFTTMTKEEILAQSKKEMSQNGL